MIYNDRRTEECDMSKYYEIVKKASYTPEEASKCICHIGEVWHDILKIYKTNIS